MGFSLLLSSLVAELAFGVRDSQQLSSSQLLLPRPLPTPVSQRMVPNHNAQLLTHAHHPGGGGFEARLQSLAGSGPDLHVVLVARFRLELIESHRDQFVREARLIWPVFAPLAIGRHICCHETVIKLKQY